MFRFGAIAIALSVLSSPVLAQIDESFVPGLNAAESEQGFQLFMKTVAFVASAIDQHEQRSVFSENAYELQPFLDRLDVVVRIESEANTTLSPGRAFWVAAESDTEGTLLELYTPPNGSGQVLTIVAKRPGVPVQCAVRMRKAGRGERASLISGWSIDAWCMNIRNSRTVDTEVMLAEFVHIMKGEPGRVPERSSMLWY